MSTIRYLLDEHVEPALRTQLMIWGAVNLEEFRDLIAYLPVTR